MLRRCVELFWAEVCFKIATFHINRAIKYKDKAKKWRDRGDKVFVSEV